VTAGDVAGSGGASEWSGQGLGRCTCGWLGVRRVARRVTVAVRVPEVSRYRGLAQGTVSTQRWISQGTGRGRQYKHGYRQVDGQAGRDFQQGARLELALRKWKCRRETGRQVLNVLTVCTGQDIAGGSVPRCERWRMMAVLG
jgi:hypothetical protein